MIFDSIFTIAAATAEHSESAGAMGQLAGQFGVKWNMLIAQMINFLLVAFLLYKFAFKPILATVEERQEKIASGLKYAEEMQKKLAESEKKQADLLREARQQAQQLLADARLQAKDYLDKQAQETAVKVEEMLAKGREANELERKKILSEVRQEVAALVVQTSAKVLKKDLSDADKARLSDMASQEIAAQN